MLKSRKNRGNLLLEFQFMTAPFQIAGMTLKVYALYIWYHGWIGCHREDSITKFTRIRKIALGPKGCSIIQIR